MSTIFCADCGTEAALTPGREVDPRDPDIADAVVWACPVCPCSWSAINPVTGTCIGAPAGQGTVYARGRLYLDLIAPMIAREPRAERELVAGRIAGYLAAHLGLPREEGTLAHLDLHQCRQAWRILRAVDYAEVRRWSMQKQPVRDSEGVAA